ncbi:type I-C CRISPR-associated protein Cas8c/Csd1 [Desulfonema ishimotonii]|uniref:Type I-C CRISPR-associated protein Cas8c/Csd1 n=1 Tax=Desulfonema ishimotonii TaxID=45657 RepID=A0A401G3Z6_9BACT|nr:type I-C CRISPR-associated protein Cas8c/Csd1 [Desulfonema ishimotonii]GBC63962.1 type I-C CRISPR-associated protein Cas8c/Csd1 [Desulfonema ishimotonii]
MILQALDGYYKRLADDPEKNISVQGFGTQKFYFGLLINKNGELLENSVIDLRETPKKKPLPILLNVPQEMEERSGSKVAPHFLWDNTGYVLGVDDKGKPEKALKKFDAFKDFHHQLCDDTEDEGLQAVLRFLDSWNPENASELRYWDEMRGMQIAFMLAMEGRPQYIHDRPEAKRIWLEYLKKNSAEIRGNCLVSGKKDSPIARLHPAIKGVRGAQTKGAAIVSFNLKSFTSYNKEQSYNAPVSTEVTFNYTTALNYLLRSDSRQKVQIGDATTVFWTERESFVEGFMGAVFDPSDNDNKQLRTYLEAVRKGKMPDDIEEPDMKFFILGLSPNASRLSVRFWHVTTTEDISMKIGQHFSDLVINREYDNNPEFPGMWQLLRETAVLRKLDNVSPVLAGAFMRAILTGESYPRSLLSTVITRIRSDQTVNYLRAAMIKAYLVRYSRKIKPLEMEVKMGLDKESPNIAYRLGRLFAVLEKAQKDAIPGAKATIKDRYYSSASATPRAVFPQLLRLAQHHIQKAEYGYSSDKRIEEIMQEIQSFPGHLSIEDQGLFALGYYHQRPELFKKSEKKEEK